MKVLKFGGTSVANAERVLNVVDILESNSEQVAVVLSAPANITNHLVEMISKTVNKESIDELMQLTETIFENILLGLSKIESKFPYEPLRQLCLTEFDQLKTIFKGIALLTLCPDKINAQIISRGEKLSIAIMQGILEARGHQTVIIDPVKSLIAHGDYLESTVDIAESTRRIQALNIDERAIILMPGFTAGNEEGELVVLGRNGSDYSASVLAACLRADSCEIWTDVDGVYTCDPRFIPNARLLSSMSYQEAMELSYFGAKVLHPRTILPIAQFKIPCIIKNTQNPQAEGTYIGEGKVDLDNPVKGITHLNDMAMINVSGPGLKGMVGMSARVFSAMSLEGISVVLITQSSSEYSISFCVPQSQLNLAKEALKESFYLELKNGLLEPISVIENLSIISVIGDGMRTLKGVSANFFGALSQANINIIAIAQGSSERSISVVVEKNSAKVAVKATHQTLIEKIQVLEVFVMGVGGVGGALVDQIQRQQEWLLKKKIDLRVCGMFNSKQALFNADGLNLQDWREQLKSSKESYSINKIIEFVKANHLCNPIFVDCTSNQNIAESYLTLLSNGFHVVTPNKKANTDTMNYYRSLRAEAEKTRRKFLYDTNVGAGLPVIENLQNLINAGDELIHFSGILSGSLSFIFGLLDEGKTLSEATLLAKEKGFTEPDPRDDLSGMDVARKLLILAREVGLSLELSDIKVESVLPEEYSQGSTEEFLKKLPQLDAEFIERVNQAKAEGKVLRYVGVIEDGLCKVQINAVDENDPLYKIKNGENALAFFTRYYQPIPLVLRGYGAGNDVTAAGVFSDILRTVSAR